MTLPEFQSLPDDVLQRLHLNFFLERVKWQALRHLRRFAHRLVDRGGSYSDLSVGPQEFRALIGGEPGDDAQRWLDQHGLPNPEDIHATLDALNANAALFEQSLTPEQLARLPLERLRAQFDLSPEELHLLLIAAAPALSEPLMRLLTVTWADFSLRQPSANFIAWLVSENVEQHPVLLEALSDRHTLVRMRLIIPEPHARWPRTPRMHAPCSVEQRVLDAIMGAPLHHNIPDGAAFHTDALPLDALIVHPELRAALTRAGQLDTPPRVLLTGPTHSGKRTLIRAWSEHDLGQATLEIELADFLREPARIAEWLREARLLSATLVPHASAPLPDEFKPSRRIITLLNSTPGALVITADTPDSRLSALLGETPSELAVPALSRDEQRALWVRAIDDATRDDTLTEHIADAFSRNYSLPVGSIFRAVRRATTLHDGPLQSHHVLEQVRRNFDHNLGTLADVVVVQTRLQDVILPDLLKRQIQEVLHYARYAHVVFDDWGLRQRSPYGNALSVLLSGPPGTGKTFLAGALANALGKVLYKVDLSRIVDKYIGETEKNLGRIFDEASRAQAVLLFDEADSLFAGRTEVKSSNDRYANLEVNYLLQRLETYNGVSILTTNFERGIDEAFQRRIRFCLSFPMPGTEERAKLWQHLVPPNAPLEDDIDWELLGESFEMSGGHIRNATLRAAVRAAARQQPITLDGLLRAGVSEAREMGTLVNLGFDLGDEDEEDEEEHEIPWY